MSIIEQYPQCVVIAGPTGSGKSALAMELAELLGGEIVSCDSVQIYRGFDIGAAKPTSAEQARVPHHLIDLKDWDEDFDAAAYAEAAADAVAKVARRGRVPLIVGGTGLYLRAFLGESWHGELPKDEALRERLGSESTEALYASLQKLDPERAAALHPNDRFRIGRSLELVTLLGRPLKAALAPQVTQRRTSAYIVVVEPPRAHLHHMIQQRTAAMLEQGLVAEVRSLLDKGVLADCKPMRSIGYKQVSDYMDGLIGEAELANKIIFATRQYAKRQATWFRKVEAEERLDVWGAESLAKRIGLWLKR